MNSDQQIKEFLAAKVWIKDTNYYNEAKQASEDIINHAGFKIINSYLNNTRTILEIGCGEGTKLFKLGPKKSTKTGVDISSDAIKIAKKQYPQINFLQADIEKLPFKDNQFDAVFSAFVLEHVSNVRKIILEMIRVAKRNGLIIFICPNFGAPNRHSPCFKGSKVVKLIIGLIKQMLFVNRLNVDNWNRVEPLSFGKKHLSDWDTVVEPEIITLIKFLKLQKMKIAFRSSLWEEEVPYANKIQIIFNFLAKLNLYPFKYWGPQLLVISQKI